MSVYVFGVLLCLSIVVAFAIDSFNAVLEETQLPADEDEPLFGGRVHSQSVKMAQETYRPKDAASRRVLHASRRDLHAATAENNRCREGGVSGQSSPAPQEAAEV